MVNTICNYHLKGQCELNQWISIQNILTIIYETNFGWFWTEYVWWKGLERRKLEQQTVYSSSQEYPQENPRIILKRKWTVFGSVLTIVTLILLSICDRFISGLPSKMVMIMNNYVIGLVIFSYNYLSFKRERESRHHNR